MRFALRTAAVALCVVLAPHARAQDDPFAAADRAYAEGRIEQALAAYESATRSAIGTAALARAHLRAGVLRAITGDRDGARRAFDVALALAPETPVPSELDPTMQALFREAQSGARRLRVSVELVQVANEAPSTLRLAIEHPLSNAAARFRVTATPPAGTPWTSTVAATAPTEIAIPSLAWRAAERLDVTVDALTEHGGVLATEVLELRAPQQEPERTPDPGPARPVEPEARTTTPAGESVVESPWFWIVTVGLAAAAAVTIGLVVGLGQDVYSIDQVVVR